MSDPDLSGAVLDERYQVIEPIARGAMGAVYRGERLKLGRAVAIKILHDALPSELSARERFEREAKLMARLEHPHCVSVIDFGLHEDKPFLVMELVRGTSLLELLAKHGPLEPQRVAELMRQVLSGLAHAHELGIIHRDIKPANIMLTEKTGLGEQVRILDFGLARPAIETTKLTTGMVVGTPNYMAPEQIKGGALDARTDLYACGVMMFELLTGTKPFRADDPIAVVRKHLHDPVPKLSEGHPELDALEPIVTRALAKRPADRYASAEEMAAAIEQAMPRPITMPHAIPRRASSGGSAPVATPSGWAAPAQPDSTAPQALPVVESAAPNQTLDVPPTRMVRARRFTSRQIVIGSGGLGLLLIIIVAATHSGGAAAPVQPIAVAPAVDAAPAKSSDPIAPVLARVTDLYSNGDVEPALQLVLEKRRAYPDSAPLAFLEGKIYFAKLWWSDGIKAFRDAIRLDAGYRSDPELIKLAVRAFLTTPGDEPQLAELLDKDIGGAAKPMLEDTARSNPNAALRARAAAELKRFP
ncbi:MAG TPA: serine/threonine-protein kinase [Kofleriaceae bacterium]|jgi:serine/threonine-protein kinase